MRGRWEREGHLWYRRFARTVPRLCSIEWSWFLGLTVALGAAGAAPAQEARSAGASAAPPSAALPPGDEPSPTPFSRLERAGSAADHEGEDYVVVHQRTVNRVRARGVTHIEGYTLYKVLNLSLIHI